MTDRISHEEARRLAGGIIAEQFPATSADLIAYIDQQSADAAVLQAEHASALQTSAALAMELAEQVTKLQARVAELEAAARGYLDGHTSESPLRAVLEPASPHPAASIEAGRVQTSPFRQVAEASAYHDDDHLYPGVGPCNCGAEGSPMGMPQPHIKTCPQHPDYVPVEADYVPVAEASVQPAPGGVERCPLCLRNYKRLGGLPRDKWAEGCDCPCTWHDKLDPAPADQPRPDETQGCRCCGAIPGEFFPISRSGPFWILQGAAGEMLRVLGTKPQANGDLERARQGLLAALSGRKPPLKLLVSNDWLMRKIASDRDVDTEAGASHPEAPAADQPRPDYVTRGELERLATDVARALRSGCGEGGLRRAAEELEKARKP